MSLGRRILLSEPQPGRVVHCLSSLPVLAEGVRTSTVTITRTGTFTDPRYGEFTITRDMLLSMVRNFESRVVGQDIAIDVAHNPNHGAAAFIRSLTVEGERLRAQVEWTEFGIEAVKQRGFRYLSAEYHEAFVDNEGGRQHGPTLLGAGLTVRPVIKRLDPVQLSEASADGHPVLIHPTLLKQLSDEGNIAAMNYLAKVKARLLKLGLTEDQTKPLMQIAEEQAKVIGEDETKLEALAGSLETTGKQLAQMSGPVTLSVATPQIDVAAQVTKILADREAAARTLAEGRSVNVDKLTKALAAKSNDETLVKSLAENFGNLITAQSTADHVDAVIALACKQVDDAAVAAQLRSLGHAPRGSLFVSVDDSNSVKRLSDDIRKNLRANNDSLRLPEKESRFATKVLAAFDQLNAPALHREAKLLSGVTVDMSNLALPVSVQREVIREALHDLPAFDLVDTRVDTTQAAVHQIPYETRNLPNMTNDGIVYEGGAIPAAGIQQAMDLAYINAVKLRMEITNEAAHFSQYAAINWDAMGRNVESNARFMQELLNYRLCNSLQRNSDMFGAVAVASESHTAQCNGTRNVFKTTNFPIVRPHQDRNLQGSAVGSAEAAFTPVLASVTLAEYDGTNTQSAANYFQITDYNLGYYRVVNQLGVVQTPANATTLVTSYSYATNVVKWDMDIPTGVETETHYDSLLHAFGARKAVLLDDRYVKPSYALMSNTLHNLIMQARSFTANGARPGISADSAGDLEMIRGVPAYGTNTPGIHLGDSRILIGQRKALKYTISKPYMLGQPFEMVNGSGVPVGKKQAYGEEYSSLKMPVPIRGYATSVIVYSVTARAAV